MTTLVVGRYRQAWRKGIIPWLRLAWDREPVIVMSFAFGLAGPVVWLLSPWKYEAAESIKSMPTKYPVPIRYVEGKTGPPTSL
ncbi:NADH dehydrogenase [ubiquinone] 1 alpha subcomplex subunit 3-like [Anneissia japonica]|uniref:NADH dehydrogenase [ubiquinone] 1 alpha subcomplex subunit 3-like n=1 Tax=Anneissia japonica TaxID=1529436 RepID=UPI0014259AD9|nr:NADH dehydrogenase [ubiquinone] 1 alpha subcomplex subunit 3-like [Anneissia japonica]